MRVLILNYEYPPLGGGAANATKYILREFSKYKNLKIDLITSSTNSFKIEKPYDNITIHFIDINKNSKNLHSQSNKDLITYSFKSYFYAKKLMKNKQYDLSHAFFGIPCGYIAKNLGLPFIVSLRGSDVPFYSKKYELLDKIIFKRLSRMIWKKADFVIANSSLLKHLAQKSSPNQTISVIPNGIDTKEFLRKKIYNHNKKLKILLVGRLIERKGFSFVIDAIKSINEKVSVNIIGDGPLKNKLKEQAKNYDINFLGIIEHDKLSKIYHEHDIFILPSFNEGMSNTVLEAMASGLPIIVTETGGTQELLNENGFLIRTQNSEDITKILKHYLNHKNLLIEHGKKSRDIAKKLSWKNVSSNYHKLYKKIQKTS